MLRDNEFGQPIGPPLGEWTPPARPPHQPIVGRTVRLEPFAPHHVAELFDAFTGAPEPLWTYLPYGPPESADDIEGWRRAFEASGFQPYAVVVDADPAVVGFACHMRIDPNAGSIEVGAVTFSPHLQRTVASTEVNHLLMRHAFDSGYRRYEWKCDDLNAPSRRAAARLGFTYEGTFRKAIHYKGRSRDTAWYSIIDTEWPAVDAAFERWLAPENFDADGHQRTQLRGQV